MLSKLMNWFGYEKTRSSVSEYAVYTMIKEIQDTLTKLPLENSAGKVPVLNIPEDIFAMYDTFENNLLAGKYTVALK